jgi:endonuclease/exonuclease/phosphatase family metal-dependent hydrolase
MRIATWNLERSGVKHGKRVPLQKAHLETVQADIYILTECHDLFELRGCSSFTSSAGVAPYDTRDRAVGVWSRWPILSTKNTADPRLTICVEVETSHGPMLVYGTVLPYHAEGAPSASRWEQHRKALALQVEEWSQLREAHPKHLMCVAGDFNMNLDGQKWYGDAQSRTDLLAGLKAARMTCVTTADWQSQVDRSSIDHICVSHGLEIDAWVWPWAGKIGEHRLSDHNGVFVDVAPASVQASDSIQQLTSQFHLLIRSRLIELMPRLESILPLPNVQTILASTEEAPGWFPVPGLYGGFAFRLCGAGSADPRLKVSSWSRVMSGSTTEHDVTPKGWILTSQDDGSELQIYPA